MINQLLRKYNQNRRTIWVVIIFIAFFVLLLHTVFNILRAFKREEQQELLNNYYHSQTNTIVNNSETNNMVNEIETPENLTTSSSSEDIINYFIRLCNENKIEEAYDIISNDCKEVLFPTINDFRNNYYNKVFTKQKTAKIEESMYEGEIYKITYASDLLANGGYNEEETLEDYVYVTREEDKPKISLNKFIYIQDINKTGSIDGISIKILKKRVYIDYEEYQIQISNNSDNAIYINPDETKVYLLDENDIQYTSNIDELQTNATLIEENTSKIFDLTFYKGWRF